MILIVNIIAQVNIANCEICSDLDQCSYKQCTENYYNPKKEETNLTEFEKISMKNRFSTKLHTKTTSKSSSKNELSLETETDLKKFFSASLNSNENELSGIYGDSYGETSDYAVNFDLNEIDSTKINMLLNRVENRLNLLTENINTFRKINIQTTLFKKNVIKFFLFLKFKKKGGDHNTIDKKLNIERSSIENLKQSADEIDKIQRKLKRKLIKTVKIIFFSFSKDFE